MVESNDGSLNLENPYASTNSDWQDSDAKAIYLEIKANNLVSEDQTIYNIQWSYTDGNNDPWLIDDNSGTWDDSNFEIDQ